MIYQIYFQTYQSFDGMRLSLGSQKTSNYGQRDDSIGALFGGEAYGGNYVFALSVLNKSPLNASRIPKFAELGLSGLGNSFKVTEADSVASGIYAGSYNKNQTVPDPNCVENGGVIAGPRCKFLYGERFNIVNDEDHLKGYLHFARSSSKIDYSATVLMAKIDVNDNPQSPSYPALSYLSKKILPGQGGSPFNVPVIWYGRPLGSAFPSPNSPKAIFQYHFSNRFIFDISQNLDFELSLTASEHENKHNRPDTIESRFEAAILGEGGPNSNEQWNIFSPLENSDFILAFEAGVQDFETDHKITYQNISAGLYLPSNKYLLNLDSFILGGITLKEGERTILTNTTSSGKLNIDSNYQTFEVHSGVTKTNSKLIPNVGLTGSFSITPSYDESKYYSWRNRKVGNVSVFFSDKYNLINNDNNNFNLGWLLDFRNSVGDKSQVYSINGTSATYKQDNALTREISLVANLGYEKKITDNGKFTAGVSAKNTNQDVKSLSGNLGFKLKF